LTAGDIGNGSWTEFFPAGEGQASTNNVLNASGTPWAILANISQTAQLIGDPGNPLDFDFLTQYNVIFEFTSAGNWGDPFILQNVMAENYSKRASYPDGNVAFNFLTSGVVEDYLFEIDVEFDSITGSGTYTNGPGDQHGGSTFEEITLIVSEVPIPGAIWLLGSGILGIMVLRKKRT
jgi:hypothetical protein